MKVRGPLGDKLVELDPLLCKDMVVIEKRCNYSKMKDQRGSRNQTEFGSVAGCIRWSATCLRRWQLYTIATEHTLVLPSNVRQEGHGVFRNLAE